ncbi:MAG: alpha/beta fold hydrolase [Dehalococcoidia bacterium]|nr:alpha/beta fold hydrolase [Dehalococcoidia bacterium]
MAAAPDAPSSTAADRVVPYARVKSIQLWYELTEPPAGARTAPTLVLTHGYGNPYWPPALDDLRAKYRLLWYHVRGHGRSSVPDAPSAYSLPQFAADLAGLLDALAIERAHIGGVSMGGMISAQFACDYPERLQSLLLCDTTCGNAPAGSSPGDVARDAERQVREAFDRMTRIAEQHGLAELTRRENRFRREHDAYARTRVESDDEQDAEAARKNTSMTAAGYVHAGRALRDRPDLVPRLPAIAALTLVSCGEWDLFYPCAIRDAALIPQARLVTIPRAAHSTPMYQPRLWAQAVCAFVDEVEATPVGSPDDATRRAWPAGR